MNKRLLGFAFAAVMAAFSISVGHPRERPL